MAAQVNGDIPSNAPNSAFIQHLLRYPVIHDGVNTFKDNHYGQRSIKLGDEAYKRFAKPALPYFARPYQYVSPYVMKADALGHQTLSKIDERFPVITKPTGELYTNAKNVVLMPYRKSIEGRDHVIKTYSDECAKMGDGNSNATGLVSYSKALVTTALIVSSETVAFIGGLLSSKTADAKEAAKDAPNGNN